MSTILREGDTGHDVKELQRRLRALGYGLDVDGIFGSRTNRAVQDFQAHHTDSQGAPLQIDGVVGWRTWWSLQHTPSQPASRFDPGVMPGLEAGGSALGRKALEAAILELRAGAGEHGGNNRGPFVRKYLQTVDPDLTEGKPWCAAFVSWCFLQACGGDRSKMPFKPTTLARSILNQIRKKGRGHMARSGYQPQAGDIVCWWRVSPTSWEGHVGLVHHAKDGILYTIEGNKDPEVQGYTYGMNGMSKLLGYGSVPDPC